MPTLTTRILNAYLPYSPTKRLLRDAAGIRTIVKYSQQSSGAPPWWMSKRFAIQRDMVRGHACYTVTPRRHTASARHIFYLHGGAYVAQMGWYHWYAVAGWVALTGVTATVPIYPLAPTATHPTTLAMVQDCFKTLPADRTTVIGDSAGGGLALALAQSRRDAGQAMPRRLMLLSPWLDVGITDPESARIEPHDPLLSSAGLRIAGQMYAGPDPLDHASVSPLFGSLAGLPPISVYTSERDLLLPDSRRLRDHPQLRGTAIEYVEAAEMVHDWMLLPIPEGKQTRRRIAAAFSD